MTRTDRSRRSVASGLVAASVAGAAGISAEAAEITFRVEVPDDTPTADSIHVAGDFQGWDPGSAGHRLALASDGRYVITLTLPPGPIAFKFTRGDWARVEKGASGEEIANRVVRVDGDEIVDAVVRSWADRRPAGSPSPPPRRSTITGEVRTLEIPGFLGGRRVWVYVPPDYHAEPERRYPVLYMLDGQNAFDAATSFAGEWRADETSEALVPRGEIAPAIVVAIANGGERRLDEYTPFVDAHRGGGGGRAHLESIIRMVMPVVDERFRTLTGPEHTALVGSSLGGLMALYAVHAFPDVFGMVGAVSPSLAWADHAIFDWIASESPAPDDPSARARIYVDMGTRESGVLRDADGNGIDDAVDDVRELGARLIASGRSPGVGLKIVEDEGGRHDERTWAERFPDVLRFLFPPEARGGQDAGRR